METESKPPLSKYMPYALNYSASDTTYPSDCYLHPLQERMEKVILNAKSYSSYMKLLKQ